MNQLVQHTIRSVSLILTVLAALMLAACGGGGGGTPAAGGNAPLATGGFIKSITYTGAVNIWNLFDTDAAGTGKYYQILYPAADIQGSGNIDSIAFQLHTATTGTTCPNVVVRMGHTSVASLTDTTYANNVEQGKGSVVTVRAATTLTIPAGAADDYFTVPLDQSFAYNGVDNLIVEVLTDACLGDVEVRVSEPASGYGPLIWAFDRTATVGGTWTNQIHTKFNFAGGDNNMNYAAVTAGTVPFASSVNERHGQMLHQANSINGSGPITGVAMISDAVSTTQTYTVNIKLGHTTLSELTANFANNFNSGSPVTVATALTFTVPAGIPAGSPIWLPITGSFNYNGTDNLIVDIEVTAASGGTDWARNDDANHRIYAAVGNATGTLTNGGAHTVFRFNGGTMGAGLAASASMPFIFDNAVDGSVTQNLYRPVDLGTGGLIDSIGVRLVNDSVAAVHSNFTIRMGHTAKTALNVMDTFASNMDEDLTVYSGSFSVPAGLKAGDWVTIPLDTGFDYDSTRNLAILFSTLGGALSANRVRGEAGPRYLNSIAGGAGSDIVPVGTADGVVTIRLNLQK
ncbi:MAG: hypothetical protein BMS9Abin33_1088 [Gammaproteobacteria bacterium]|nr:MAG: hypothetical protein BMS9Abin33_1088 [Gammaproteobacteria bacterium]